MRNFDCTNSIGTADEIRHFCLSTILLGQDNYAQRKRYSSAALDKARMDSIASFYRRINVLKDASGRTIPSGKVDCRNLESLIASTCLLCFNAICTSGLFDVSKVKFDVEKGYYFTDEAFTQDVSLFINYLIAFDKCVIIDDRLLINDSSYIGQNYKAHSRSVTLKQLKDNLSLMEQIGADGERFVLNYEKKRLPEKQGEIERISDVNTAAGFDVLSFQTAQSTVHDRFIEVKTYSSEMRFIWSSNEVNIAQRKGDSYCIYLVNHGRIGESGYEPVIIINPYKVIIEDKNWIADPASFECRHK
jgi:hypothetical protein